VIWYAADDDDLSSISGSDSESSDSSDNSDGDECQISELSRHPGGHSDDVDSSRHAGHHGSGSGRLSRQQRQQVLLRNAATGQLFYMHACVLDVPTVCNYNYAYYSCYYYYYYCYYYHYSSNNHHHICDRDEN